MSTIDQKIILGYLNKTASDAEYEAILKWIGEDENNKKYLFDLESLYNSIEWDDSLSDGYLESEKDRLLKRISDAPQIDMPVKKKFNFSLVKIAACILLLFSAIGFGYLYLHDNKKIGRTDLLSVQNDGVKAKEVILEDGTKIWLNQNSTISYPPTFEGEEERRVYLTGEAYFEVTKNKKSPFYVESKAFNVRVLGTSFNIKSSNMSNISSVTLVNGEIEVKGNNNEGHVTLSPGQKAEINHTDHRLKVYETNAVLDVLWHNDLITFENATLLDIRETLESLYEVKIYLDPSLNIRSKYSGVIKKRDSIDSVLNSLTNTIPFKYQYTGRSIRILPNQ